MTREADHAMGLELQIEELQEQFARARVQGREADCRRLQLEIDELQSELVATAERLATIGAEPDPAPELHDAEKLSRTD